MTQLNFSFDEEDISQARSKQPGCEAGSESGDADQLARGVIANELEISLLVEAAAGTGKTKCLVDRIVNLLATGYCKAAELVVVTFTRKAAAELQSRVQSRLRTVAHDSSLTDAQRERVSEATRDVGLAFIGTIHSFAASVLRERPIEFQVPSDFREMEEAEDAQLRAEAWTQTILQLRSEKQSVLSELEQLGVESQSLKGCFDRFIEYRDIEHWPNAASEDFDQDGLRAAVTEYVEHMRRLLPSFPAERGNDKLMAQYETIVRAAGRDISKPRAFWRFLTYFDRSASAVQKMWPDPKVGKAEKGRFEAFREEQIRPAFQWLRQQRYSHTISIVQQAVRTHQELKRVAGGLDFTDLLQRVVMGLREIPALRTYFQKRYRCILVDEFQDTDPMQAELLLLLTATDVHEQDWTQCVPHPGSLFVVGDPKQSIYRFRRGDIQTYSQVKQIFQQHGKTVTLQKNFRSTEGLLRWSNQVFGKLFPQEATPLRPAFVPMLPAEPERVCEPDPDGGQMLSGVFKLTLAPSGRSDLRFAAHEAKLIAKFIQTAIQKGWKVHRSMDEQRRGKSPKVTAGDFLILPWSKRAIGLFRKALLDEGVACEVSGNNAFQDLEGLRLLLDCLRTVDDPNNPVPFLSVCRDRMFGIGDADLYRFKKAGGRFRYTSPIPESLAPELRDRFISIQTRFRRYQLWLRMLPFIPACQRIAEDLGLLAVAATSEQGDMDAGSMLNAIEWIRHQSRDFDSTADLIGGLEELLVATESQGMPATTPATDVVRVMNLHKAKGLEAPVVFLCDSGGVRVPPISTHIDRFSGDREHSAAGYMCIRDELTLEQRKLNQKYPYKKYQPRILAAPGAWEQYEKREQEFLDAESERLLYVAATRGKSMVVVCQGAEQSRWAPLYPHLQEAEDIGTWLESANRTDANPADIDANKYAGKVTSETPAASQNEVSQVWGQLQRETYAIQSAKSVSLKGSKPKWQASDRSGAKGYRWGSALHDLLDLAARHPGEQLEAAALRFCAEYGVEASLAPELLQTADSVLQSEMWQRATRATRKFSEIPFEARVDLREKSKDAALPTVLRGVIDLVFEESDGWVIVDYKTDELQAEDLPAAKSYYWPQLRTYAQQWTELTGFKTKEVGLYFTNVHAYAPELL